MEAGRRGDGRRNRTKRIKHGIISQTTIIVASCETYLSTHLALRHLLPLQGRRQIDDLLVDRTDLKDVINDAAVGRHRRCWRCRRRRWRRRSRCRGGRHGLSGAR